MRLVLPALALVVLALAAGCREERSEIDRAIGKGVAFLVEHQDDDGAWRSGVYGAFKGGDALTPLALRALAAVRSDPQARGALERGLDYLAARAPGRAAAVPPLFAVYTAAQALEVLSRSSDPRHRRAHEAWRAELEGRQLTGALGWLEDDPSFGGWGYSTAVPRKSPPGSFQPPLVESNTSATVFALQALSTAGALTDGAACRDALVFLERMQNFSEPQSAFDDGGFFFIHDDPVRNKAGVAGTDGKGRTRFHSYGSTTADGLRALLLCGRSIDSPRARAALAWLQESFVSTAHPGVFAPRLEADRNGLFFYWAASVTETLVLAKAGPWLTLSDKPPIPWAEELAHELIRRQGADGAWSNVIVTMREDEPIIATSMALIALAKLREVLAATGAYPGWKPPQS